MANHEGIHLSCGGFLSHGGTPPKKYHPILIGFSRKKKTSIVGYPYFRTPPCRKLHCPIERTMAIQLLGKAFIAPMIPTFSSLQPAFCAEKPCSTGAQHPGLGSFIPTNMCDPIFIVATPPKDAENMRSITILGLDSTFPAIFPMSCFSTKSHIVGDVSYSGIPWYSHKLIDYKWSMHVNSTDPGFECHVAQPSCTVFRTHGVCRWMRWKEPSPRLKVRETNRARPCWNPQQDAGFQRQEWE